MNGPGFEYCMNAIIGCGLHNFYPIFHCGLYLKMANNTDNLCTKQGNLKQMRFIKSGICKCCP